jgi:DNA-binding response OmpR family regulator
MEVRPTASTEDLALVRQPSVLIVDRCEETREVLTTALERRGLRTLATGRVDRGLELARLHRPDLIVLDLELEGPAPDQSCARFARQSSEAGTPLVLLGSCRRLADVSVGEFVVKPYHYGPLIRRIEEMLSAAGRMPARCA